jgi:hypothetical protein
MQEGQAMATQVTSAKGPPAGQAGQAQAQAG